MGSPPSRGRRCGPSRCAFLFAPELHCSRCVIGKILDVIGPAWGGRKFAAREAQATEFRSWRPALIGKAISSYRWSRAPLRFTRRRRKLSASHFHWLNRRQAIAFASKWSIPIPANLSRREDRVRGYQLAKDDYLNIEEEDLEAIEIESSHTIDIESFIPRSEIDPVYLESSHYLAPNDKVAEEAFAVIREAMAAEGVAGIGRAVISRRERLLVMDPRHKGILATVLHYSNEVRDDNAYFESIPDIQIPAEMLDLAKHIIRGKMGHFDISKFEDRYENALIEMIRAKQAGRPVEAARPAQPANVINLMDALRKSIASETGAKGDRGGRSGNAASIR